MKPAWDQLMMHYETSEDILIADVDCTAEGEQLCTDHEIQGYPTLKYGAPDALKDYEGMNEFQDLLTFARENLGPSCGPGNMELCNDEQKATIEEIKALGLEKIEAKLDEYQKFTHSEDEKFHNEVEKLQKVYEKLMEERDEAVKVAASKDLIMLEKISAYLRTKDEEVKEEL